MKLTSKKIEVRETKVNAFWTKEMVKDIRKISGLNNINRKETINRILKYIN